ncbi:hypothetical protein F2Q69_00062038 [Brassica cretica]|uniref:WIBG Mago-binding domain-containing protein n=1 Tax=Brassica cretica TaxID=69181 RepID=A0A8S9RM83_BRACR|nr:hypothetical protein F2Q69_00062038 [Brassica cretica]
MERKMEAILARLEKLESLRRKDQRAVANLLEKLQDEEEEVETAENQSSKKLANDEEEEVDTSVKNAAANQSKEGDTAAGNDVKDAVVSPISGDCTTAENQSKKLANDEEEEEDPSVKNAAANQSKEGDTEAGNDVKDAVVSPISGDCTAGENQSKEGDQNDVAILLEKMANDEEEEVDPSVKNGAANQSKEGDTAAGNDVKDAVCHRYLEMARRHRISRRLEKETPGYTAAAKILKPTRDRMVKSPASRKRTRGEDQEKSQQQEGDQNAVAILLEKLANDEEEEVDPSVKNAAANQSKEGDTAAGKDVKDDVVSLISGDGTAAENQSKEGDQNDVAILLEKLDNDEEEEVDPSVKNAVANHSKAIVLFEAKKETPRDTAAANDGDDKDAVVSPVAIVLFEAKKETPRDTAAANQSKEGDTEAGNDVKDGVVSPISGDCTAGENQSKEGDQNDVAILLEKMANDEEEEVDPSVKNAAANQSKTRRRGMMSRMPWCHRYLEMARRHRTSRRLEKETPGDTAAARILKPTQRPDGTLRKAIKIRDGWVPEDEVAIYRHPHPEVQIELSHVLEIPKSMESIHFFNIFYSGEIPRESKAYTWRGSGEISAAGGDGMTAENQSKEGDQNAVAILLEKLANDEEEEEGDTAAGKDVMDDVVSLISGDGTAAENQSKEGDQNDVAILLEKLANDEEEEVDPSVKNAVANHSKAIVLFEAKKETPRDTAAANDGDDKDAVVSPVEGDTAAGNDVKDAVVSPISGDDTTAENQSKEGDTVAGNDVKDAVVSPLSGDGTAAENQVEAEKETPGDTAAANDGDVKDAVVSPVVRPRIRRIKRPWNVVTDTEDKVISTASSPNMLEKETPGDTAEARILKPTQRPDGTLRKAMKIRDRWVPEDEVVIYRHPHSEVKSPASRKRTRGEDQEKP